ncbi:MAG: hypothetical protein PVJ77_15725, partial [Desulfobacterales bacterium]
HFWIPALRSAVAGMTGLAAGKKLPISPLNGGTLQRQLIEYKCNLQKNLVFGNFTIFHHDTLILYPHTFDIFQRLAGARDAGP